MTGAISAGLAGIEARLAIPPVEGPNKVLPLADMVRRHVRHGMTLHLSTAHVRSHAPVHELMRQFWVSFDEGHYMIVAHRPDLSTQK